MNLAKTKPAPLRPIKFRAKWNWLEIKFSIKETVFIILVVSPLWLAAWTQASTLPEWESFSWGRGHPVKIAPSATSNRLQVVTPQRTGIQFTNALRTSLVIENNNFMQGAGVALGDVDNDNLCDVFLCAIDGANRLYRNLGDWKFEDVTAKAGLALPIGHTTGASFADLNGDGFKDLIITTLGNGPKIFLNQTNSTFLESTLKAGVESNSGSLGIAVGDVDEDGDVDLYISNYGTMAILRGGGTAEVQKVGDEWKVLGPYANRLRYIQGRLEEVGEPDVLFLNDGKGHFTPVPWNSEYFLDYDGKPLPAPWDFGLGAQIRDINEDGHPDIYVCNDFQTVDRIWINHGRGRFRLLSKSAMRLQSYASMGVDFADIDRDGKLDIFVVEMHSRDVAFRKRQVGSMESFFPIPGRFDNRLEVTRNTLFWNRGDGSYAEIANFSGLDASDWSWQPAFIDIDFDGFEDVLIVNGHAFNVQDRDVLEKIRSMGKVSPSQSRSNLLLYPKLTPPNALFRNRGNLKFEDVSDRWAFNSKQVSHGLALGDLDNDGDQDIVVNCLNEAPLVYRNQALESRVSIRVRGKAPNTEAIGAKLKLVASGLPIQSQEVVAGGRYLAGDDPVRSFAAATNQPMSLFITWPGGEVNEINGLMANYHYEIDQNASVLRSSVSLSKTNAVSDVKAFFEDVSSLLSHLHREEPFDDYERQPLLQKQLSSLGPGVAWFDLNGDHHDDLFIGSGKGGKIALFRGDGKGKLSRVPQDPLPQVPDDTLGLAGFVWENGRRTLLSTVASYENTNHHDQVWSYRIDPGTRFLTNSAIGFLPSFLGSLSSLACTDFDSDGDLDLFVGVRTIPGRYPLPGHGFIIKQEAGVLQIPEELNKPFQSLGLITSAIWTDVDQDSFPDLVITTEWGSPRIFLNKRDRFISADFPLIHSVVGLPARLHELTGLWNSVASGDFDNDGLVDLVLGNWGENGPDRAVGPEAPLTLYFGDLSGRGMVEIIETEFHQPHKSTIPRRSLASLGLAIPRLHDFYSSHASFASVSVDELLRKIETQASKLQAITLSSMILLNRSNQFELKLLPLHAQWSPLFGIAVEDFDNNGTLDLFCAQNFSAYRPELPRTDSGTGLLLVGDGKGSFRPLSVKESGIRIFGDQRGVAVSDYDEDGRADLVVAQNGHATRLFRNIQSNRGIRFRIHGNKGNPDGIGVQLRLKKDSVLGPIREIQSGSGYLSHSSSALTFPAPITSASILVRIPGGQWQEFQLEQGGLEYEIDSIEKKIFKRK